MTEKNIEQKLFQILYFFLLWPLKARKGVWIILSPSFMAFTGK